MEIYLEKDALSNIASLVTIMSLVITPIFFFVKRWYDKKSERKMISQNLYGELRDTLDAPNTKQYSDSFFTLTFPSGEEIQCMHRLLNHDVYDSLIYSGKINFLRHNLQQRIQDVFKNVKAHNEYIIKIGEILIRDKTSTQLYDCYKQMENIETKLLKIIPGAIEKLAKDTKIS